MSTSAINMNLTSVGINLGQVNKQPTQQKVVLQSSPEQDNLSELQKDFNQLTSSEQEATRNIAAVHIQLTTTAPEKAKLTPTKKILQKASRP
jgi:hypothetical protein